MNQSLRQKLANYKMPEAAKQLVRSRKIVFLVGISGAGKNTVLNKLLARGDYRFIISHTTRPPRRNNGMLEKDGEIYHFITIDEFEKLLDAHKFVEAKIYSDNAYGTSIDEVAKAQNENKIAVTELEIQGVAEYKNVSPGVVAIFLLPPNFETWQARLKDRYGKTGPDPADRQKRLATAKTELEEALSKDYFEFVINDDLTRAVTAVDEIVAGHLSAKKNDQAKQIAKELLAKIEKATNQS